MRMRRNSFMTRRLYLLAVAPTTARVMDRRLLFRRRFHFDGRRRRGGGCLVELLRDGCERLLLRGEVALQRRDVVRQLDAIDVGELDERDGRGGGGIGARILLHDPAEFFARAI